MGLLLVLLVLLIIAIVLALDFFICAGLVWVICWAFGLVFTWKIAIGVWVITLLLSGIFKATVNINKD